MVKKFSDFSTEEKRLDGDKVKIDEILGKEITILAFRILPSKHNIANDYLILQFSINDENKVLFTGSKVLQDQLERYKDQLPFMATIIKPGKFYTLS